MGYYIAKGRGAGTTNLVGNGRRRIEKSTNLESCKHCCECKCHKAKKKGK